MSQNIIEHGATSPRVSFTIVPNYLARSRTLSPLAKALWIEMQSHVDGWRFTIASLANPDVWGAGRDAVERALGELISEGWLTRSKRADGGVTYRLLNLDPNPEVPDQGHADHALPKTGSSGSGDAEVPDQGLLTKKTKKKTSSPAPSETGAEGEAKLALVPQPPETDHLVTRWRKWYKNTHGREPFTSKGHAITARRAVDAAMRNGVLEADMRAVLRWLSEDSPPGACIVTEGTIARARSMMAQPARKPQPAAVPTFAAWASPQGPDDPRSPHYVDQLAAELRGER